MSDTPITDAFAYKYLQGPAQTARHRRDIEWHEFSRQLERKLNVLKASPNEADQRDAARYRWLCEHRKWTDDMEAAIDCGGKASIDASIEDAMEVDRLAPPLLTLA